MNKSNFAYIMFHVKEVKEKVKLIKIQQNFFLIFLLPEHQEVLNFLGFYYNQAHKSIISEVSHFP